MESASVIQLLLVAWLACAVPATGYYTHLMTSPHNRVLEIGTNFTATCTVINTSEVTADDLEWVLGRTPVPKERYTKLNTSALSVTIPISKETPDLLWCFCTKDSQNVKLNRSKFQHGIVLKKDYAAEKPENLSCKALQEDSVISPTISCKWEVAQRQTGDAPITYTLFVKLTNEIRNSSSLSNTAQVTMEIYPNHLPLEIWVEAHNVLARKESQHLYEDANTFVKTNPPANIQVISERTFASSLLMNWTPPVAKQYLTLIYQLRFCPNGSHVWSYVPLGDIAKDMQSFRLQNLQPDTVYTTQLRCKNHKERQGYWSDWSTNATERTPEARPSGKPDLWRIITDDGGKERRVQFVSKDPVHTNGRITNYVIRIQHVKDKNGNGSSEWETVPVNRSEWNSSFGHREITPLREIALPEKKSVKLLATAVNSVGPSSEALLGVPAKVYEIGQVQEVVVRLHDGHLQVEWKAPNNTNVTEYVVEWVNGDKVDWQRESKNTMHTVIRATLEPFVCYTVSVYPLYLGWIGKVASVEAFVEEGAPSKAPEVALQGDPGRNEAILVWKEIPGPFRNGFITGYILHWESGTEQHEIPLPANATSYKLTSLSTNTKYDVWIVASTTKGSCRGNKSYFTTLKYAPGEIESIVVGVSLGFLSVFLLTMLFCICKKEMIKENFWPQIPNPGESTIGNWSPDYAVKAETPKENGLSGISVLDVDVCDTKCVFEEDKASLALKKDKYQSEEHSSGIGGSSCMSSPRQSVSDSDEGGDMADTTASTVQYSSVVASNGYKGQTPSAQAQQAVFLRSESTQPLLDSEENPDVLVQEGSRPFSRKPCFAHGASNKDAPDSEDLMETEPRDEDESLNFCPLEDEAEQAGSGYMPQLGGYRPQ